MIHSTIITEKVPESGIGIITLNRPEVRNAIDPTMRAELMEVLSAWDADPQVRAVILTGGRHVFAAGADVAAMVAKTAFEQFQRPASLLEVTFRIERLSKPVIAAMAGFALGGGCELALACDLRIAGRSARIGQTEINVGTIPGAGGTVRLARLVGIGRAKELILTGKIISAEEAYRINLVNTVVDDDRLMEEAVAAAQAMTRHSPVALALAKYSIQNAAEASLQTAAALENACFALSFSSADQEEGMRAFLEKRKPHYQGR